MTIILVSNYNNKCHANCWNNAVLNSDLNMLKLDNRLNVHQLVPFIFIFEKGVRTITAGWGKFQKKASFASRVFVVQLVHTSSILNQCRLLGDFNMPEVIWDNTHAYNPSSELLIDLATLLFLNQQVSTPTRKSNVLDLIFCSDELIKSVDATPSKYYKPGLWFQNGRRFRPSL